MKQWDPDLLFPEGTPIVTSTDFSVGWQEETAGIRLSHEVSFSTGSDTEIESRSRMLWRIICHVLISQIPESGFKETSEVLLRIRDFYQERLANPILLLAESSEINAKWGRSYQRPEFHASEE